MKKLFYLLSVCFVFTSVWAQDAIQQVNLLTYGGLPVATNERPAEFKTLYNTAFITGYSDEYRNPLWTVYRYGNMKGDYTEDKDPKWERPREFQVDVRTASKVSHGDYTSSGYDRGHMAPNSGIMVQYGQMAQMETYFMSNICPQKPDLNRGIWMHLEGKARTEISQDDERNKEVHDLFVITGPIFNGDDPETLESGVAIPDAFYKIFAYKKSYGGTIKAVAFIFPHDQAYGRSDQNFLDYAVTVDAIEEATGLNFFPELSEAKQRNLESVKRNFALEEIND